MITPELTEAMIGAVAPEMMKKIRGASQAAGPTPAVPALDALLEGATPPPAEGEAEAPVEEAPPALVEPEAEPAVEEVPPLVEPQE
jgi:hypothetical protein